MVLIVQNLFNGMYEVERNLLHLKGYIYANFEMDENGVGHMKLTREIVKRIQCIRFRSFSIS